MAYFKGGNKFRTRTKLKFQKDRRDSADKKLIYRAHEEGQRYVV